MNNSNVKKSPKTINKILMYVQVLSAKGKPNQNNNKILTYKTKSKVNNRITMRNKKKEFTIKENYSDIIIRSPGLTKNNLVITILVLSAITTGQTTIVIRFK